MSDSGWIGVDLDGTLAHYDKWRGVEHIGLPIEPMMRRVRSWLDEGQEVRIMTARVYPAPGADVERTKHIIQDWLEEQGLPRLEVTNQKDWSMVELWDDRCVQVIPNTGIAVRPPEDWGQNQ